MFKEGDRIVPISLKLLRFACVRNTYLKAGNGVCVRAKEVIDGYEVRLRVDGKYQPQRVRVKRRMLPGKRKLSTGVFLCCDSCGAPAHKFLYLDWDSFSMRCSKCMGIPHGRMKRYGIYQPKNGYSLWDYDEAAKFRRIMRKKLICDIARFEFEAIKAMSPEDFFSTRPYLVPEVVALLKYNDPAMYHKLLHALIVKYRAVVQHYRLPTITRIEEKWLDTALRDKVSTEHHLNKGEQQWLVNHWNTAPRPSRQGGGNVYSSGSGIPFGTTLDLSSLLPSRTASTSLKTSFVLDMSAPPVTEKVKSNVKTVEAQADTPEENESSTVPNAPTE